MIKQLSLLALLCTTSLLYSAPDTELTKQIIEFFSHRFPNRPLLDTLSYHLSMSGNVNPDANKDSLYVQNARQATESLILQSKNPCNVETLKFFLIEYEEKARRRYIFCANEDKKA